ncbi:MAG: hypothetical protein KC503_29935 [Myxococcales bacterium]|nr:hypothetical protein [Myxococcales bacterium]
MRMQPHDMAKYHAFTHYVRVDMPAVGSNGKIMEAIQYASYYSLSDAKLREALQWGSGPLIKVVPKQRGLEYGSHPKWSDILEVGQWMVEDFERGRGAIIYCGVYEIGVTLLHELTHWADEGDGSREADKYGGEIGWFFERRAYQNEK